MARHNLIASTLAIEPGVNLTHLTSDSSARVRCEPIPAAVRAFVFSSYQLPCGPPSRVMSCGTHLGVTTCY